MDVFTILLCIAMAAMCCVFVYFVYVFLLGKNIKVAQHAHADQSDNAADRPVDSVDKEVQILKDASDSRQTTPIVQADAVDDTVFPVVSDADEEGTVLRQWDEQKQKYIVYKFNRSFTARLIQSKQETKNYYSALKNEIMSYKNVKSKISWRQETFKVGGNVAIKMRIKGKTLCLYLALNPSDYAESKYKLEDVSSSSGNSDTPCMYRILNERRNTYAVYLIAAVMAKNGAQKSEKQYVDYAAEYPYEHRDALIEKNLIKVVSKEEEPDDNFYFFKKPL
ncbi:MAG: hypothetical protein ACI4MI_05910 [Christensenellales bacterium]